MNTIVVLVDSLRRDFMGCYGNPWIETPNFDEFAESSIVFDNAYIGSFPCMPARRELMTGRYEFPWRGWGPLEVEDKVLPRLLKETDTVSMAVTDHFHYWERGAGNYLFDFDGTDFIRGQEYDLWRTDRNIHIEYPTDPSRLAQHAGKGYFERYARNTAHFRVEEDYFAPQVFESAATWLENNAGHDDFFLMIDCFDPHEPFDPPSPYNRMYNPDYEGDDVIWPTYGWNDLTEKETRQVRALYAGEVTMVDKWFGKFMDKVKALDLLKDTMIILVTDHGHMFGEHGIMGKPWTDLSDSNLYQELAHIPMMIYHPKLNTPGRRVADLVQIVDVYSTVLEHHGVKMPEETHGRSLLPYILGDDESYTIRDVAWYGRFGEAINITDGEWTLFLWPSTGKNTPLYFYSKLPPQFGAVDVIGDFDGTRYPVHVTRGEMNTALYNIKEDYRQTTNLAKDRPDIVRKLVGKIKELIEKYDAPREQLKRLGIDE